MLILFRSLCTEENVYSIEPIYPPYKLPVPYVYTHYDSQLCRMWSFGERNKVYAVVVGLRVKGLATSHPLCERRCLFTIAPTQGNVGHSRPGFIDGLVAAAARSNPGVASQGPPAAFSGSASILLPFWVQAGGGIKRE
jgi:hypothetical protein